MKPNNFYLSFHLFIHSAWGLSLMWITLSCCWGIARPVNSFLSYNGFFPLSRLTYCTYLIHPTVMMMTSFQFESPMHLKHGMVVDKAIIPILLLSHFTLYSFLLVQITAFMGNATISFLIAFALSLMFEAPVIRLLKLCFR